MYSVVKVSRVIQKLLDKLLLLKGYEIGDDPNDIKRGFRLQDLEMILSQDIPDKAKYDEYVKKAQYGSEPDKLFCNDKQKPKKCCQVEGVEQTTIQDKINNVIGNDGSINTMLFERITPEKAEQSKPKRKPSKKKTPNKKTNKPSKKKTTKTKRTKK